MLLIHQNNRIVVVEQQDMKNLSHISALCPNCWIICVFKEVSQQFLSKFNSSLSQLIFYEKSFFGGKYSLNRNKTQK